MQGLQIYDEGGNVTLDVNDRITKILGSVVITNDIENVTGSLVDPELATGTPFYFCLGNETLKGGYIDSKGWNHGFYQRKNTTTGEVGYYPQFEIPAYSVLVKFEGSKMSWDVNKYAKWWVNVKNDHFKIVYGVY